MSLGFWGNAVANAIGSVIAAALVAIVGWLAVKWSVSPDPSLVALALVAVAVGVVTFFIIHQRYAAILTRRGRDARAAYDLLRENLAGGGLTAHSYTRRLSAALDAVDRFFGDAGMADRTLWPHAFGLRTPAALWTAASFERCLLLALFYPNATIFAMWTISGHLGPAERALLLIPGVSGWQRACALLLIAFACFALYLAHDATGRVRRNVYIGIAFIFMLAGAEVGASLVAVAVMCAIVGISYTPRASVAFSTIIGIVFSISPIFLMIVYISSDVLRTASDINVSDSEIEGFSPTFVASMYSIFYHPIVFARAAADLAIAHPAYAALFSTVMGFSVILSNIGDYAKENGWEGPFNALLVFALTVVCISGANMSAWQDLWRLVGPLLLFPVLLTLVNAPFDWFSLGLTRALLRRGIELGGWWPYFLALADALLAAVMIAILTCVMVIAVQAFDAVATHAGGENTRVLPLAPLFDGIGVHPGMPEYWWTYSLLLSTMIPSLVNLTIGGVSLLRGVPWLTTVLLRNMPERGAPAIFERAWMTLLLTLQVFLGALLGIAAQALLSYFVIGFALPLFGLDLLDLARIVAVLDLPGLVMK